MIASLDILCSGLHKRKNNKKCNLCANERRGILKELLFVASSVRECLRSRILESSPKLPRKVLWCYEALQENIFDEAFFKKSFFLVEHLPTNNHKIKIRSSHWNFSEQVTMTFETHSKHISFSLIDFFLQRLVGSEFKRLSHHRLLLFHLLLDILQKNCCKINKSYVQLTYKKPL